MATGAYGIGKTEAIGMDVGVGIGMDQKKAIPVGWINGHFHNSCLVALPCFNVSLITREEDGNQARIAYLWWCLCLSFHLSEARMHLLLKCPLPLYLALAAVCKKAFLSIRESGRFLGQFAAMKSFYSSKPSLVVHMFLYFVNGERSLCNISYICSVLCCHFQFLLRWRPLAFSTRFFLPFQSVEQLEFWVSAVSCLIFTETAIRIGNLPTTINDPSSLNQMERQSYITTNAGIPC